MAYAENKKIGLGVGVLLVKNNKVLLGKRNASSNEGDTWSLPGGKMDYGETFEQTAIREVYEETKIHLEEMRLICVNNDLTPYVHFATIGFLGSKWTGEAEVCEPEKMSDWTWFELDNLPNPLFSPTEKIIECYKRNLFYLAA